MSCAHKAVFCLYMSIIIFKNLYHLNDIHCNHRSRSDGFRDAMRRSSLSSISEEHAALIATGKYGPPRASHPAHSPPRLVIEPADHSIENFHISERIRRSRPMHIRMAPLLDWRWSSELRRHKFKPVDRERHLLPSFRIGCFLPRVFFPKVLSSAGFNRARLFFGLPGALQRSEKGGPRDRSASCASVESAEAAHLYRLCDDPGMPDRPPRYPLRLPQKRWMREQASSRSASDVA